VRKILASLFVISAVLGIGIFTTGAYFTSSVSTTNQSFVTGTAGLKFGQCGAIGADCTGVAATLSTFDMGVAGNQMTGPGKANSGCLVIQNTGDYDLTLKTIISYTTSAPDFGTYFQLAADRANGGCASIGALIPWTTAATAQANSPFAFDGTLAVGQRMYVILYNQWDSAGDQNALQGKWLNLTLRVDGQTV
jgi:hypothetical protein